MQRLGIVGFGSFGRFAAGHLKPHFEIVVSDRLQPQIDDEPELAGVCSGSLAAVAECDTVVLAVPVQNMDEVMSELAPLLRPDTLVVEVASVKEKPAAILERWMPSQARYLGLHPMFGPQSGKDGIAGLKVVLTVPHESAKCASPAEQDCVVRLLEALGLTVIPMQAADHDREMAYIQGLTHWMAKALREVRLPDVELATPAYRHLLRIEEILREDSPELFLTIQRENGFTKEARAELLQRLEEIEVAIEAGSLEPEP